MLAGNAAARRRAARASSASWGGLISPTPPPGPTGPGGVGVTTRSRSGSSFAGADRVRPDVRADRPRTGEQSAGSTRAGSGAPARLLHHGAAEGPRHHLRAAARGPARLRAGSRVGAPWLRRGGHPAEGDDRGTHVVRPSPSSTASSSPWRMTRDPELRATPSGVEVAQLPLAVPRRRATARTGTPSTSTSPPPTARRRRAGSTSPRVGASRCPAASSSPSGRRVRAGPPAIPNVCEWGRTSVVPTRDRLKRVRPRFHRTVAQLNAPPTPRRSLRPSVLHTV
jgi:hypothetical protein